MRKISITNADEVNLGNCMNIYFSGNVPPTVAPMRATRSNTGIFILKTELSTSHVSASASRGLTSIKALENMTAVAGRVDKPC